MVSKNYGRYRSGLEKKFAEALPRKFMAYEPFDMPDRKSTRLNSSH